MAATITSSPASQVIQISEREWQPFAPGLWAKPLWSHPAIERRAQLTRFEPGASLPMHRHVGDELMFVIEGSLSDEFGTVTPGNMSYRPNGCVHTVSSKNGAIVMNLINGTVEPASDFGDAPGSQVFTVHEIPWTDQSPGVYRKVIWDDRENDRYAALIRVDPGGKTPMHRHPGEELMFVIEGTSGDHSGEVTTGNMVFRPAGCVHQVGAKNGTTVLVIAHGTPEIVEG